MNRAVTSGGIDAESIGSHLRTHCAAALRIGDTGKSRSSDRCQAMPTVKRDAIPRIRRPTSPSRDSRRGGVVGESSPAVAGVRISHPDRLIYPDLGISKIQLAQYYEGIAEWIVRMSPGRDPSSIVSDGPRAKTLTDAHRSNRSHVRAAAGRAHIDDIAMRHHRRLMHLLEFGQQLLTSAFVPDEELSGHEVMPAHFVAAQQPIELGGYGSRFHRKRIHIDVSTRTIMRPNVWLTTLVHAGVEFRAPEARIREAHEELSVGGTRTRILMTSRTTERMIRLCLLAGCPTSHRRSVDATQWNDLEDPPDSAIHF